MEILAFGLEDGCQTGLPFLPDRLPRFRPPLPTITLQPDETWTAVLREVSAVVKHSLPQHSLPTHCTLFEFHQVVSG